MPFALENKSSSVRFGQVAESMTDSFGLAAPELAWYNATVQDINNPIRYHQWRVFDHEHGYILDSENWHRTSTLHNGEVLYATQVNNPIYGSEHQFDFTTDINDVTASIHSVRFGVVSNTEAVITEIQLPWIGTISQETLAKAIKLDVDFPGIDLAQILELYAKRRDRLRRFNLPRLGNIPPSGLISIASTIKLMHDSGVKRIYLPMTLPKRHSRFDDDESYRFHNQTIELFHKACELIHGLQHNSYPDEFGYLYTDLSRTLASNHRLLYPIFS